MELIGEFDLRQATKEMLRSRMDTQARLYEELCVQEGAARIDLALMTDRLEGFEIKSDFDNCKRLPRQAEAYNSVFDTMSIITGPCLAGEASAMVPKWWGLAWAHRDADHTVTLRWLRTAKPNPARSALRLAQLLWREEASEELAKHVIKPISKRATRAQLQAQLAEHIDADGMRSTVIRYLRNRPTAGSGQGKAPSRPGRAIDLDPDWLYPELYETQSHAH